LPKWSKALQQKALSLMQFQKKFGTEKACQEHLFRLRWPEGFRCPRYQQFSTKPEPFWTMGHKIR
jgi:hypothetical protein